MIFCPRLTTATPAFQKVLEGYVAAGGKLIQFEGDGLIIKGSIVAKHGFGDPSAHWEEVQKDGGYSSPIYRDLQWRKWNNDLAPTFARDFAGWVGEQPYRSSNHDILLGVHKAGAATYLLFANNAQSQEDPRGVKAELVPAETTVTVPASGVVYDLFNGGEVPMKDGKATLRLGGGGRGVLGTVAGKGRQAAIQFSNTRRPAQRSLPLSDVRVAPRATPPPRHRRNGFGRDLSHNQPRRPRHLAVAD